MHSPVTIGRPGDHDERRRSIGRGAAKSVHCGRRGLGGYHHSMGNTLPGKEIRVMLDVEHLAGYGTGQQVQCIGSVAGEGHDIVRTGADEARHVVASRVVHVRCVSDACPQATTAVERMARPTASNAGLCSPRNRDSRDAPNRPESAERAYRHRPPAAAATPWIGSTGRARHTSMLGTRARVRACRHRSVRAVSSPGAPHRGGGLPASKPGLSAGARDTGKPNRAMLWRRRAQTGTTRVARLGGPDQATRQQKDPPRTRQSLLILAAFRPWGGSQDGRRTGGRRPSLREAGETRAWPDRRRSGCPVSSPTEDSPSGLGRTIGNRVGRDPSGVQIPYPPPTNPGPRRSWPWTSERRPPVQSQF